MPDGLAGICTVESHQEVTRSICPCVSFDSRCHECPDPGVLAPCFTASTETPKQEIRRLRWIVAHVAKLSPHGRRWLIARLTADES